MGNRAVIAFGNKPKSIGIYLHWNGGRDSVEAFLQVGKDYGIAGNSDYTPARLCQIIGNYFGGTNSLRIGTLDHLDCDNHDNGVFAFEESRKESGPCPINSCSSWILYQHTVI